MPGKKSGLNSVAVAIASVWAWWKNNAFTKKARVAKEQAKR
jgi:SPP1 family holin